MRDLPKLIFRQRLSVSKLSNALYEMTNNKTMQRKANELSIKIKNENGIQNTISVIEKICTQQKA